jgi:hypothetical protein
MGKALLEIHDRKLYRATHRTFEAYCVERWDISRRWASRLMRAVPIAENLGVPPGQVREGVLHELDGLPADAQRRVFERACAGDAKPTILRVREAREAFEAGVIDGPASVPLPPPRPTAADKAEGLIDRLRTLAGSVGRLDDAGPLLDRLLEVFRRPGRRRRRVAAATA